MKAQELKCGNLPQTEAERAQILNILGRNGLRNSGCVDPVWTNGDRTYRLILEYSKGNTATTSMASYAQSINKYYNPFGIFFEINIIESPCTTCLEPYDPNWWQDLNKNGSKDPGESYSMFSHPYSDCIYGRITENGAFNASGQGSYGSHGFWSIEGFPVIIHELGHALGLAHTFNQFKENDHEVVKETHTCACNCLEKADLICDTPADPFKSQFEYTDQNEVFNWNSAMFDETNEIIINTNNKVDLCGTNWKDIDDHALVFKNHMSYHGGVETATFTKGQEYMMKMLNENKPWQIITGTGSGIMSIPGGVIDEPTTYSESKIINSDMEISSTLIVKNANLFFNGATKIVMKSGGRLILDNAKLLTNTDGSCFAPNGKWKGIIVEGRSDIILKNNSIISEVAEKVIVSNGHTLLLYLQSGSEIINPNKTALDLKNGVIYLKTTGNSIVHGHINITNGSKLESYQTNFLAGDITLFNTGLQIYDQSEVRGGLIVNNSNIKFVDLKESKFYGPVILDNKNYSVKILSNKFYHIGGLRVNAVKDFDIFDNDFFNCDVCLRINGEPNEAKNLIFNNRYDKSRSDAVSVLSTSTGLALECNTMTGSLTRDWNIQAAIASEQGDNKLAAGNLFSRAATEINYNVPNQVIYRYNPLETLEKPINISGIHANLFRNIANLASGTKCSLDYPQPPIYPAHCTNGIKDQNELAIDCGGSCKKCNIFDQNPDLISVDNCSNGVKDGDETGKDCGGKSCPPCDACNDGVQNNGENGIDCGGIFCPPCNVLLCSNGLLDIGEQSTDCGGVCPPCTSVTEPTCHDGLQNQNETGTDCGGNCPPCGETNVNYLATCYNSIKDGTETDIDCGGSCHPCDCTPEGIENDDYIQELKNNTDQFMSQLQTKYGSTYFLSNETLNASKERTDYLINLDGGNTSYLINLINGSSHSQEQLILTSLNNLSPFVSEKAIHTLFSKSEYFTQSDVAYVVRNNPAVMKDRYINSVVNTTNSFNQVQIDNINNAALAGDIRTEVYEKQRIRSHYMHQLVRNHLAAASQGLTPDFETIRCQLLRKDDNEIKYQVYQTFIDEGQYNFATVYLGQLDPQEITDPFYRNELFAFKTLHSILMNYYFAGNKIVPMPESIKQNLLNLASGCNGKASINATNVYNELFRSYIEPSLCTGDQSLIFKTDLNPRSKLNESIYVKPNPASDEIEIWNEFGTYDQNLNIKISDINGNQVYHENLINKMTRIDISQWKPGVYIYIVYNSEVVKQSSKFIKINK